MAKDPALPGPVSTPEGGKYPSSEEVREADAAKAEEVSEIEEVFEKAPESEEAMTPNYPEDGQDSEPVDEILTRSEVINLFGEKIGQLLLDGGYSTVASTLVAADEELEDVKGIGEAAVKKIRELAPPKEMPEGISRVLVQQAMPEGDLLPASVRVQRIRASQP